MDFIFRKAQKKCPGFERKGNYRGEDTSAMVITER